MTKGPLDKDPDKYQRRPDEVLLVLDSAGSPVISASALSRKLVAA